MIERSSSSAPRGDLAGRFLLPALAALHAAGRLPDGFRGRRRRPRGSGRRRVPTPRRRAARASTPPTCRAARARRCCARCATGRSTSPTPDERRRRASPAGDGPVAAYLALPPGRLPGGRDGARRRGPARGQPDRAREAVRREPRRAPSRSTSCLAEAAGDAGEQAVFRVDHVLGMATVQNLLALRRHEPRARRGLERRAHRAGRDPLGGDARPRGPRRLLRQRRGAQGRDAEPHAPGPLPARDGAARQRRASASCATQGRRPALDSAAEISTRRATVHGRLAARRRSDVETWFPPTPTRRASTRAAAPRPSPRWCSSSTTERWRGHALRAARRQGAWHGAARKWPSASAPRGSAADELWIGIDGPDDIVLQLTGRLDGLRR